MAMHHATVQREDTLVSVEHVCADVIRELIDENRAPGLRPGEPATCTPGGRGAVGPRYDILLVAACQDSHHEQQRREVRADCLRSRRKPVEEYPGEAVLSLGWIAGVCSGRHVFPGRAWSSRNTEARRSEAGWRLFVYAKFTPTRVEEG